MKAKTKAHKHQKASRAKAVQLEIRVRTSAPDVWLGLTGKDLRRRLITTGSQCRATVYDVFGQKSTKGLTRHWAKSECWKKLDNVRTKRPRNRLRHLDDLLEPLIVRERLQVKVRSTSGLWIPLARAVANPLLVI